MIETIDPTNYGTLRGMRQFLVEYHGRFCVGGFACVVEVLVAPFLLQPLCSLQFANQWPPEGYE